jgi:hypothetical protein
MTDVSLDEAVTVLKRAFESYPYVDSKEQAYLTSLAAGLQEALSMAERQRQERERAAAARKQETAEERKKLRDELIPKWCEENLKPGMVVKVKANSLHKFRQIESITPGRVQYERFKIEGKLVGRHCHYDSRGQLIQDAYITDHVLRNVQGVVLRVDARGKPIVTPIMELIEGVNET